MRKKEKSIEKRVKNNYSESFKISVLEEISSGKYSQAEVQRRHGIRSSGTISAWIRKYGKTGVDNLSKKSGSEGAMKKLKSTNKPDTREQELLAENKRLKKDLRAVQVKNLVHETMLEIIDEDYGLDRIKKKLNIEQLSDYEPEILRMYKL